MLLTAFILGLAGSWHCAGMCCPLVMVVTKNRPMVSGILYNTGRIFLYALLGAFVSAFGSFVNLAPYQQTLSIVLGCVFILVGLSKIRSMRIPYLTNGISWFTIQLKNMFGVVLQRRLTISLFLSGMLNGLLPCGLTYLALTTCLILPTAMDGFLFMICFGLGTWPVMLGFSQLLNIASLKNKLSFASFSKIAMVFLGCLLLLRVWWVHPHSADRQVKPKNNVTICK